jgi:hypothetical protein
MEPNAPSLPRKNKKRMSSFISGKKGEANLRRKNTREGRRSSS